MAEFQEVMKQAKRMCSSYGCEKCPLGHVVGDICPITVTGDDEASEIERIVMDWAEKHPEPIYPTWTEWLRTFSADGVDLYAPIPADIAEKLRIKPVGGNDNG